ncbi:cyanophycinase [Spirosoma foliorum]|uniref:Cyanophycinase n=1 Tax=Spirosoma foliorum TaxID=2710596 RepID=A0A7G5GX61_9BACT|nr:cyanophycinase [Spirosoma foliorum]QMW03453.1 cyanophycinase [Spirosoma foliorum]
MINPSVAGLVILVSLVYLTYFSSTSKPANSTAYQYAYTSWIVGDTSDVKSQPLGGVLLAGGSTDVDAAMRWFLRRSGGGDVLILRASGKDGYNEYLYKTLGESVNSVETILLDKRELASNPAIIRKIRQAEAIFFAGGDQENYVNFWQGTPVADALNERIRAGAVMGGTSAGCGILGQTYFSALEGSVTSEEALADPYDKRVAMRRNDFLTHPLLANIITDMHYSARNRQGRHVVFMARAATDWKIQPRGIGMNEKTAVCATPDGNVTIFGQGNAYFLQATRKKPERCQKGQPLTWNRSGKAVQATILTGSLEGNTGFNLRSFRPIMKAQAEYWSVNSGVLARAFARAF